MYGKDSESLKSYKTILSPIRGPNQETERVKDKQVNVMVSTEKD